MTSTTPGGSATREAAEALTGVETTARSLEEAAAEPASGITGAQSLVRSLEAVGVDVIFGIPGGAILPAYDPLFDSKVRHVLVRHEQGAGHAATGYAQATGKVGVCMATSGPARCWSTSPRTSFRRPPTSPGRRGSTCPATSRPPVRTASRSARPPHS